MAKRLDAARAALVEVIDFVAGNTKASPNAVFSGSVPYLMLAGNVMAGWQMARSMLAAEQSLTRRFLIDTTTRIQHVKTSTGLGQFAFPSHRLTFVHHQQP